MANRDTAKPWFQRGKKPTQAQFEQLFDWVFFKDEGVAMANVAGLLTALQGKADAQTFLGFYMGERFTVTGTLQYDMVPGSLVEKVLVLPSADCTVSVGSTPFGNDLIDAAAVTATEPTIPLEVYAAAARSIHFSGLPANSSIVIFKRLVKQN